MISRCPSCGVQVPEEAKVCPSCGWDFAARGQPAKPADPGLPSGLKSLPKLEPRPIEPSSPEESSLQLPEARPPRAAPSGLPALPPARSLRPEPAPPSEPAAPAPAPPSEQIPIPAPPLQTPVIPRPPTSAPAPGVEPSPQTPAPIPPPSPESSIASTAPSSASADQDLAIPLPPPEAPSAPPPPPPPRKPQAHAAAIAGLAIVAACLAGVYLLTRPRPAAETSAAPRAPAPSVAAASAASAAVEPPRSQATFDDIPRVAIGGLPPPQAPVPGAAAPPAASSAAPPPEAGAPESHAAAWAFQGMVFDVATGQGVFGAKLVFLDPVNKVVGRAETSDNGSYEISLPPGGPQGYVLKVAHDDYLDRAIDQGAATSALRQASAEERQLFMKAAPPRKPWVGQAGKTVRRDVALIPRE